MSAWPRRLATMPATRASLAAGDITARHAHVLAGLAGPATAAAFAQAEAFLVGQARTMRWADFTRAMAYWRREARPDDPDTQAKSDWEHRGFGLHDGLRGTGLVGELTPLAEATLAGALGPPPACSMWARLAAFGARPAGPSRSATGTAKAPAATSTATAAR